MGHTHRCQLALKKKKKNQVRSPSLESRVPETGSDPPIGSGRDSGRDNASLKSTKIYISMFSDKPPCMPLCFGTVDYTARGDQGFFLFLSLYSSNFFSFFKLYSSGFFFLLFFFPPVPLLFLLLFLLSYAQFSTRMGYVIVLGSVFSPDGLCNCERHLA